MNEEMKEIEQLTFEITCFEKNARLRPDFGFMLVGE